MRSYIKLVFNNCKSWRKLWIWVALRLYIYMCNAVCESLEVRSLDRRQLWWGVKYHFFIQGYIIIKKIFIISYIKLQKNSKSRLLGFVALWTPIWFIACIICAAWHFLKLKWAGELRKSGILMSSVSTSTDQSDVCTSSWCYLKSDEGNNSGVKD